MPVRRAFFVGLLALGLHAAEPSYMRDIRPIIQRQCQGCHQPALKSSKLDLTSFETFQAGGQHGPAFQPGASAESLVVKYVSGELKPQMPLGQPPLAPEQIQLLRDWIAAGAKDDTPPEAREALGAGKPVVYTQPPVLTALAFSPDGKTLAVSAY
ncbi:MAG TPA: c-type cytochrome domain-containing protein, partial [Bryobacterales bacterium]|nr:c-type cytochrome domain-containing protein [Bryobacterales bacterium]